MAPLVSSSISETTTNTTREPIHVSSNTTREPIQQHVFSHGSEPIHKSMYVQWSGSIHGSSSIIQLRNKKKPIRVSSQLHWSGCIPGSEPSEPTQCSQTHAHTLTYRCMFNDLDVFVVHPSTQKWCTRQSYQCPFDNPKGFHDSSSILQHLISTSCCILNDMPACIAQNQYKTEPHRMFNDLEAFLAQNKYKHTNLVACSMIWRYSCFLQPLGNNEHETSITVRSIFHRDSWLMRHPQAS